MIKITRLILLAILFWQLSSQAQSKWVGINTENPKANLDIHKLSSYPNIPQGVSFPNFHTKRRSYFDRKQIEEGTMIYNTHRNCLEVYGYVPKINALDWYCQCSGENYPRAKAMNFLHNSDFVSKTFDIPYTGRLSGNYEAVSFEGSIPDKDGIQRKIIFTIPAGSFDGEDKPSGAIKNVTIKTEDGQPIVFSPEAGDHPYFENFSTYLYDDNYRYIYIDVINRIRKPRYVINGNKDYEKGKSFLDISYLSTYSYYNDYSATFSKFWEYQYSDFFNITSEIDYPSQEHIVTIANSTYKITILAGTLTPIKGSISIMIETISHTRYDVGEHQDLFVNLGGYRFFIPIQLSYKVEYNG